MGCSSRLLRTQLYRHAATMERVQSEWDGPVHSHGRNWTTGGVESRARTLHVVNSWETGWIEVLYEWREIMQCEWTLISVDCYGGRKQGNIKFIPTQHERSWGRGRGQRTLSEWPCERTPFALIISPVAVWPTQNQTIVTVLHWCLVHGISKYLTIHCRMMMNDRGCGRLIGRGLWLEYKLNSQYWNKCSER